MGDEKTEDSDLNCDKHTPHLICS